LLKLPLKPLKKLLLLKKLPPQKKPPLTQSDLLITGGK
jgi:hypothetical protein